jgi:hypothetical protein
MARHQSNESSLGMNLLNTGAGCLIAASAYAAFAAAAGNDHKATVGFAAYGAVVASLRFFQLNHATAPQGPSRR